MEIDRSQPMDRTLVKPGAVLVLPGKYRQEPPPGMKITWRLATVLPNGMQPRLRFIWGMEVAQWPGYLSQNFYRDFRILEQSFRGRYVSLATPEEIQGYLNQAWIRVVSRRAEIIAAWDAHLHGIEQARQS